MPPLSLLSGLTVSNVLLEFFRLAYAMLDLGGSILRMGRKFSENVTFQTSWWIAIFHGFCLAFESRFFGYWEDFCIKNSGDVLLSPLIATTPKGLATVFIISEDLTEGEFKPLTIGSKGKNFSTELFRYLAWRFWNYFWGFTSFMISSKNQWRRIW